MDKATVKRVASLARLAITEEEQEKYAAQLGGIFKWIDQLNEVDTANVEPLASVSEITAHLRPDRVDDGGRVEDILANAPESTEGFFVVPKIIE